MLDLYAGWWEGVPLAPGDCIVSADEKTSIQARVRCHATTPPLPGQPMRVEHEYARGGALAYLAAWDVRRGGVIGRCETTTGIVAFGRLVDQVMQQEPYRSAPRVFWVVDNGSSHRGEAAAGHCQLKSSRMTRRCLEAWKGEEGLVTQASAGVPVTARQVAKRSSRRWR